MVSGRSGKSGSEVKKRNFKISIIHKLGPYKSPAEVKASKAFISKKLGHASFSSVQKSGKGFSFSVKTTYVKKLPGNVPTAAVTKQIKSMSPGAQVKVIKA